MKIELKKKDELGAEATTARATQMGACNQSLLDEIVRRVLTVSDPERIILFGSAATGGMTSDSDIDLLVVEKAPSNPRRRSVEIRRALRGVESPFDVIVISAERFRETQDLVGTIAYPAAHLGRVIYEAR